MKFLVLSFFISFNISAGILTPRVCDVNRYIGSFSFTEFEVTNNKLTRNLNSRSIAKAESFELQDQKVKIGLRKTFQKNNKTFVFHFENPRQPNSVDDYLSISNNRGHKIIYPLKCKLINTRISRR